MKQGSLLPFLHEAEHYVEEFLGKRGADLEDTARAIISYDLAMLALGCRPKMSMHCAAMTAAQLLCLGARLQRAGAGPACDADPQYAAPRELEADAGTMAALPRALTQQDVTRALSHFRQAALDRGIDLVAALAMELKCVRIKQVAQHHREVDAQMERAAALA